MIVFLLHQLSAFHNNKKRVRSYFLKEETILTVFLYKILIKFDTWIRFDSGRINPRRIKYFTF